MIPVTVMALLYSGFAVRGHVEGSPGTCGQRLQHLGSAASLVHVAAPIPHPESRTSWPPAEPHLPGTREEPGVSASLPRAGDEWLVYLLLPLSVPGRQRPGRAAGSRAVDGEGWLTILS